MQELRYKLGYNDSINRWWITEMGKEAFLTSEARAASLIRINRLWKY